MLRYGAQRIAMLNILHPRLPFLPYEGERRYGAPLR
jgi:hypothetical protein